MEIGKSSLVGLELLRAACMGQENEEVIKIMEARKEAMFRVEFACRIKTKIAGSFSTGGGMAVCQKPQYHMDCRPKTKWYTDSLPQYKQVHHSEHESASKGILPQKGKWIKFDPLEEDYQPRYTEEKFEAIRSGELDFSKIDRNPFTK